MTSTSRAEALLLEHLARRTATWDPTTLADLEPRKREELEFHNLDRAIDDPVAIQKQVEADIHANKKWYSVTQSSHDYIRRWLETESKNAVVLDYACGNGGHAIAAASAGASLAIGLDISDVSVLNARRAAAAAGLADRCIFIQGDCEDTGLPDASIDRIICSGMLHHLDLTRAFPELRRILKPGGRILCIEALAHNPLMQWYRRRTPHLRTKWEAEHILRVEDMLAARQYFALGDVRYWHLAVLAAVPLRGTRLFGLARATGQGLDFVLARLPGIRRWAWQFTFELLHPEPR